MAKSKITFVEIAKKAGVGVGTVSRYFNDYNISKESKTKIKNVLDGMNYVPNYAASTIKKPNKDVFLILPYNPEEKANNEIANGVKNTLSEENINFFIFISSNESSSYREDLKNLLIRNSYGIVMLLPKITDDNLIKEIREIKTTNIIVYNRIIENINSVGIDDYVMFKDLALKVDSIFSKEKINFIGLTNSDVTTGKQRNDGFKENVRNNYVILNTVNENSFESVWEIMDQITRENKSKIIVCATHTIASTVDFYLKEKNIRKDYFVTDIVRKSRIQDKAKFELGIYIDYFLVGQNIGKKLLGKKIKLKNLFKIK